MNRRTLGTTLLACSILSCYAAAPPPMDEASALRCRARFPAALPIPSPGDVGVTSAIWTGSHFLIGRGGSERTGIVAVTPSGIVTERDGPALVAFSASDGGVVAVGPSGLYRLDDAGFVLSEARLAASSLYPYDIGGNAWSHARVALRGDTFSMIGAPAFSGPDGTMELFGWRGELGAAPARWTAPAGRLTAGPPTTDDVWTWSLIAAVDDRGATSAVLGSLERLFAIEAGPIHLVDPDTLVTSTTVAGVVHAAVRREDGSLRMFLRGSDGSTWEDGTPLEAGVWDAVPMHAHVIVGITTREAAELRAYEPGARAPAVVIERWPTLRTTRLFRFECGFGALSSFRDDDATLQVYDCCP